jgi:hypothetical protein
MPTYDGLFQVAFWEKCYLESRSFKEHRRSISWNAFFNTFPRRVNRMLLASVHTMVPVFWNEPPQGNFLIYLPRLVLDRMFL